MQTTGIVQGYSAGQTNDENSESLRRMSGISSRHFLKLVEDQGQIGFWSLDFANSHIVGSVGLYRCLGLEPSRMLEFSDLVKMMHPDDRDLNSDMLITIQSGQAINREFRVIRPDQTLRWIQNKAEVIVDAVGVPTRAVGLIIDVTEQHEARIAVEEGWHSYRSLIAAMAAVKWRMLPNGKIISLRNWEELSGQTLAEADAWGWLAAIHPAEREAARLLWAECISTGRPYAIDLHVQCIDGIYRPYLVRGAPVLNPNGSVREWIGLLIATAARNATDGGTVDDKAMSLKAAQIRAARALLNWSIEDLSAKAEVSISTIRRLEHDTGKAIRLHHMEAIREALEQGGVRFGYDVNAGTTISLTEASS
ncbi:PAS domain-containing protein [Rhizobium sp. PP-WC-2G-219]|uniref:PAS domain-containing protein n=1 Tax=Rhizobium sp. PP-CC-3G-465 TaxID=2135648 RepID=UPI000D8A30BF|nr:PAS domain-containing protein [Rhizobium sp. PP-WC-1G-195]PYE38812.1 PAS domain-containing protein [Rhizobium sp. PP-F2F-G20b]TCL89414.1 PAS domain-containing protein [Rhizobium sp. PP-WC-2G-219]TCP77802.1 PAS domain-containing protein [Rhizobium sp. PP-CC-2G-626]TCQ17215.1 PAS domain-containing protein [Rhizobium sp. PP-CC-3G-465]